MILKRGEYMYDVIIIGAGPAGLTSAIYLRRAGKKVLVLESKSYGGQIINAHKVANYPGLPDISGFDLATNMYKQAKDLGTEFKYETAFKIKEDKTVVTNQNEYKAKAIIIATGTSPRKLGLPNEDAFLGKGLSYCATCDGNFFKNQVVAVIGGGNTALEDALYLSNIAQKVYLIHRREEFRAEENHIAEIKNHNNIELILNTNLISLNGDEKLKSITLKDKDNNIKTLEINGLFVAIGEEPHNENFQNVISLNNNGYIITKDGVHTKTPGIYVAGDARDKEIRQLTTAVSDGTIAAMTAIKEMKGID